MEKLLKKLLYGEEAKPITNKSRPNTILSRYERVQRLRNIAIDDNWQFIDFKGLTKVIHSGSIYNRKL